MASNDDVFTDVNCDRKKVNVMYIPDAVLVEIIPSDSIKGTRRSNVNPVKQPNETPESHRKTRYSRSGRLITSRLERLSVSEKTTPKKAKSCDSESDGDLQFDIEKPTDTLFEEENVDGSTIFSFRTPKKQNGMVTMASESVKKRLKYQMEHKSTPKRPVENKYTPKHSIQSIDTPKRPKENKYSETDEEELRKTPHRTKAPPEPEILAPKTPYHLRGRVKRCIAEEVERQELDILLEDSGSEYNPTSSESESETSSDSDIVPLSPEYSPLKTESRSPLKKSRKPIKDFVFSSDDYFDRRFSRSATSNNTLNKLNRPKLAPSQLSTLLKSVPNNHVEAYNSLEQAMVSAFRRWIFALSEGYNIMLYGLGSKRHILADFRDRYLKNTFTIEINGYFPDIMMKDVILSIATNCLKMKKLPNQPHEIIEAMGEKMKSNLTNRIFLLFSNLDGKNLLNEKTQTLISQLVALPKVNMIATVDHINSGLLFDQRKLSAFNFIWEDATTFRPYTEETSYEGSLMVNWSGGMAFSSLKNVFISLNKNSRKVFKILLQDHLENHGPKYPGMHFSDLYRVCRSGFVVSSDLALRTLLTEFIDHQLIKWKKESDYFYISVELSVLKQFESEIESYM